MSSTFLQTTVLCTPRNGDQFQLFLLSMINARVTGKLLARNGKRKSNTETLWTIRYFRLYIARFTVFCVSGFATILWGTKDFQL